MICPRCGQENGTRNVCEKCGNFLNNKNTQRVTDPQILKQMKEKRRKSITKGCLSSTLLVVGIFVIGSLLMILLISIFFRDEAAPNPSAPSTETVESAEGVTPTLTTLP